jgi:hypothetical protein
MSNRRPTKEYRSREKVKCDYCPGRGRDVKPRPTIKALKEPACNNCAIKWFNE